MKHILNLMFLIFLISCSEKKIQIMDYDAVKIENKSGRLNCGINDILLDGAKKDTFAYLLGDNIVLERHLNHASYWHISIYLLNDNQSINEIELLLKNPGEIYFGIDKLYFKNDRLANFIFEELSIYVVSSMNNLCSLYKDLLALQNAYINGTFTNSEFSGCIQRLIFASNLNHHMLHVNRQLTRKELKVWKNWLEKNNLIRNEEVKTEIR